MSDYTTKYIITIQCSWCLCYTSLHIKYLCVHRMVARHRTPLSNAFFMYSRPSFWHSLLNAGNHVKILTLYTSCHKYITLIVAVSGHELGQHILIFLYLRKRNEEFQVKTWTLIDYMISILTLHVHPIWSLTAILQKSKELIIHIHISWFKTDFAVKNAMKTNTLKWIVHNVYEYSRVLTAVNLHIVRTFILYLLSWSLSIIEKHLLTKCEKCERATFHNINILNSYNILEKINT